MLKTLLVLNRFPSNHRSEQAILYGNNEFVILIVSTLLILKTIIMTEVVNSKFEFFWKKLFARVHFLTFSLFASSVNCNVAGERTAVQKKIMIYSIFL